MTSEESTPKQPQQQQQQQQGHGQPIAWRDRYRNGFFLAPMVRVGTLPMRLLCLEYGANLVWTPEIIDKSIVGADRIVDEKSGVISFIKSGKDVFATHPSEKDRVVFQLGSADPETALAAARTVEQDVSGIDLNCGCPKKFSISGGMGAALMSDPDRLCAILDILVKNMSIPVTCKIRVFDDVEQTLALVRRIAATGISALTVHCRTRAMRPSEKAMWHRLNDIVKELPELPIVLNGDVVEYRDAQRARDVTGATSVMTARGAAANPSIFRSEGMLSPMDAAVELTRLAVRTSNVFLNTKYILMQMHPETKSKSFEILNKSRRYSEMCEAMGLSEYYESEGAQFINERSEPGKNKQRNVCRGPKQQTDVPATAAAGTSVPAQEPEAEQACKTAETPSAKRIKT